ncbi:MAG: hypothetical protein QOJ65_310 [Fimbriimonadaceae bacterium]|jgi:hypothetical protein|nr:hypothetical protein [Fimbriimonadaceae bacterium]
MSFAVRLSTDLVSVEAGATMPLSVEVTNKGPETDRFELEVEGLDPEWTAIPVPTFQVGPGETASEKIFFRPPRAPESQAGNYPFVVKVRSLSSGEQKTAQSVLQIKPFHHISAELSPKKGYVGAYRRKASFTLTLVNLGNTEHTLQLSGSDPEEALTFEFEHDQVTLGSGQQKDVQVIVQPTTTRFFSSTRLYGFSVTARSTDTPTVAAAAQAQLEQRPAFTPSTLVIILVTLALALLWWKQMPTPTKFELGVSLNQVSLGDTVIVWWRAENAVQVHLDADGVKIFDGIQPSGSVTYVAKKGGPIDISGYAKNKEGKQTEPIHTTLAVDVPQPAPLPKIELFTATPETLRVGESVVLNYKFNDAVTKASISPIGKELNLNDNQIEIPITQEGPRKFTVIAENRDGKVAKKSVLVSARLESEVKIIDFSAKPTVLMAPGGNVTVSWQLTNAVHAEITPNPNSSTSEVDPVKGSFDIYVTKTTTFTLTSKDRNNLAVITTLRVIVEADPIFRDRPGNTATGVGP